MRTQIRKQLNRKRTQGKWHFEEGHLVYTEANAVYVANSDVNDNESENCLHDAAFIAAAPDMMALIERQAAQLKVAEDALKFYAIKSIYEHFRESLTGDVAHNALAAIRKLGALG